MSALNAIATPPRPSSSASSKRDSSDEMLFLGQRCNHDACSLVDFLPLKCQYCQLAFCSAHHATTSSPLVSPARPGHVCAQSPPSHALNRTTPLCPLCSLPVLVPVLANGMPEDPNLPMERHIATECRGAQGKREEVKRKKEEGRVCWRKGCGKGLVVKIRCDACNRNFCPSHRYPKDHSCPSLSTSTPGSTSASAQSSTTSLPRTSQSASANHLPFGARRDAAMAAMKRFGQNVGGGSGNDVKTAKSSVGTSSSGTSKPTSSIAAKFGAGKSQSSSQPQHAAGSATGNTQSQSKTLSEKLGTSPADKRRRAELASQFESLQKRHEKGLLSATEKVRYAEMVAQKEAARRKGGDDCVVQ